MTRRGFFKALIAAAATPVIGKLLPRDPPKASPAIPDNSPVLTPQAIDDQYALMRMKQSEAEKILQRMRNRDAAQFLNKGFADGALFRTGRPW